MKKSKSKNKLGVPPTEASQNLTKHDTTTPRQDGRSLRKAPPSRQFNARVTEEFYQELFQTAQAEGKQMREIIEIAVREYIKRKRKTK